MTAFSFDTRRSKIPANSAPLSSQFYGQPPDYFLVSSNTCLRNASPSDLMVWTRPGRAAVCCRPSMRFVPSKSIEQQDLQALHRIRSRMIGSRTQLGNQIRGLLAEYGIVLPLHLSQVRKSLPLERTVLQRSARKERSAMPPLP